MQNTKMANTHFGSVHQCQRQSMFSLSAVNGDDKDKENMGASHVAAMEPARPHKIEYCDVVDKN